MAEQKNSSKSNKLVCGLFLTRLGLSIQKNKYFLHLILYGFIQ